ncbi:MAG: AsmA family protein, partial [Bacteroidales bacterium]|nr:AsmA family protein [Bacteroidales bacterium]
MRKWLKIISILFASLIGVCLFAFGAVCFVLFSPKQLTPLVNKYANEFIDADVKIEKIDMAYFSVYPFVWLNIDNVLILEKTDSNDNVGVENFPSLQDTLTFIPKAKVKLNINQLLFKNNLIITQLELCGGVTNVHFDTIGKMNWDIFPADDEVSDTTSTALDSLFNTIDVKQIIINSGHVNYRNEQDKQFATIQSANLQLDGSFIEQKLLSEIKLNLKNVDYFDGENEVRLSGFQTKMKGDLFNSQVDVISDIIMDSLAFKDKSMRVFFPHMTLNLESTSNFKDGKIRMQTIVEQIRFDYENEVLLNNPNIKLALTAEYFSDNQKISLEKGEFFINEIPFKLTGDIEMKDSSYFPHLAFNLDTTRFAQIHELLPKAYADMLLEYAEINDGQLFCNGTITGKYSDKSMPNIDLSFGLKNMDMVVNNSKVDTLNLVSDVTLRMNDLRTSTLTIHDFYYSGHLGKMSAKAVVKGFTDNPYIETELFTDLNLRRLYRLMVERGSSDWRTRGTIHAELRGSFTLEDAMNVALDKIKIDGVIAIDSLLVSNREDTINVFADHARLRFGSQVDDTTLQQGVALFRASMRLDSMDLNYKEQYTATIGRLSSGYRIEPPKEDTVNVQTARISFRGLHFRMPKERMRLNAGRTSANIRITPNPEKPASPIGTIRVSLDSLFYRKSGMAVRLNSSQLNLDLKPQVLTSGGGRRGRGDTISAEARQQQRLDRLEKMS